jgi:PAS domain S-box-containing protein
MENKLEELCSVLALSIEVSLEQQNYQGLSKTIAFTEKAEDIEFVALIQKDAVTGIETVFKVNPAGTDLKAILSRDSSNFILRQKPVKTELLEGYVVVGASQAKLTSSIEDSSRELVLMVLMVLGISFVVFFFLAKYLTNPISYLTEVANQLIKGNYEVSIDERSNATELLDLNRSLVTLRKGLLSAREKNQHFNRQLENEIRLRTKDLENTRLRLLEAQEVGKIGSYEVNLDTGEWSASATVYAIFGMPDDFPLTNHSWQNLLDDKNVKSVLELFENARNTNAFFQKDLLLSKNSHSTTETWISITGRSVVDIHLKSEQLIRGTIQDISERKNIEKEVKRLSLVAEKTSNSVIITDRERRILWVNESTVKLTGYRRDEIVGQKPTMFQFEKTSQETQKQIRENLAQQKEVNAEILNRAKDGREYWLTLNIVPMTDEAGQHIGYMSVQSDITERVMFERELKRSEENYRNILENSSEMIHTIDNQGKLVWASRSWKEKLGLSNEPAEGLNLLDFLEKQTLSEFQRVMPSLNNGESVTDLDCVFLSRDGSALSLEGRAIPVVENGVVVGSQAYLHDITKIKKAENDLRNVLELTKRQNERLRNFTHIVSHNLRSHSSNLAGLIYLLSLESPDFIGNVYFTNFRKAVDNLMDVISNLSEVALIETSENADFEKINLIYAVENAIANVYGLARNAKVSLHFEPADAAFVNGNQSYIDSIILNLLTNAIKYKADNRPASVEISVKEHENFMRLDVKDNGLGIDLERQGRKIFGMYKTFHHHPDARGIGLFLTKNQVEAMGGRIEVQSTVNVGSTFSVFLRRLPE